MSKLDLKSPTETGMGGIGDVLQKAEESAIILWCSELHNKLLLVLLFPLSNRLQGKEGKENESGNKRESFSVKRGSCSVNKVFCF